MSFIVMWFFLMTRQHAGATTVGPFKSEAQCREAQAVIEQRYGEYAILLPCWRGQ